MDFIITSEGQYNALEYKESSFNIESSVYEVVRIIDGVALFLEDHYQRLLKSVELQGLEFHTTLPEFRQQIASLLLANGQKEGNVKFACFVSENKSRWALRFIDHSYPSMDDYKNGVPTELLFGERVNPNAKVIQSDLRALANKTITDKNLYEVLLVNQDGKITEGSRSNVFFCQSGVFYTAPPELILEGITRRKVIDSIQNLGLELVEVAILADEINGFDSAFITGTSPKVLPIRSIGNRKFDVRNEAVSKLIVEYDRLIGKYISRAKHG